MVYNVICNYDQIIYWVSFMGNKTNLIKEICQKYHIQLMYVFGSQKETALQLLEGKKVEFEDPLTDIDIGVVFERQLPCGRERTLLYSKIYNQLDEIFSPNKLDLVFLEENHSVFQAEAIKGYCIYAKSNEVKEAYEEAILRRACDFKPFLELYYKELLEDLKP